MIAYRKGFGDILAEGLLRVGENLGPDAKALFANEVAGVGNTVLNRKGQTLDHEVFKTMRDEFYQLRGWDTETGLPTAEKLKELGLSDLYSTF